MRTLRALSRLSPMHRLGAPERCRIEFPIPLSLGIEAFSPGGLATTREWIQIKRADPAQYAKDLELFQAAIDYVKKGRR